MMELKKLTEDVKRLNRLFDKMSIRVNDTRQKQEAAKCERKWEEAGCLAKLLKSQGQVKSKLRKKLGFFQEKLSLLKTKRDETLKTRLKAVHKAIENENPESVRFCRLQKIKLKMIEGIYFWDL